VWVGLASNLVCMQEREEGTGMGELEDHRQNFRKKQHMSDEMSSTAKCFD
jgi:hypothetical protein